MTIEQILTGAEYAFNIIPNKRLDGGGFKNTYAIASAIGKYKKAQEDEPPSYIFCYTLRTTTNDKERDTDHWEVFCEYDEVELTPQEQAEQRLNEMRAAHENDEHTELYTWNIAQITKTNEHYNTA